MLTAYPLMIETENYYNGELLSTYAVNQCESLIMVTE